MNFWVVLFVCIVLGGMIAAAASMVRATDPDGCGYEPEPRTDDVRLCAPAASPRVCLEMIGYHWRCDAERKESP